MDNIQHLYDDVYFNVTHLRDYVGYALQAYAAALLGTPDDEAEICNCANRLGMFVHIYPAEQDIDTQ